MSDFYYNTIRNNFVGKNFAPHSDDDWRRMAAVFAEDFANYKKDEFAAAVKYWRQNMPDFPTTPQLRDVIHMQRRNAGTFRAKNYPPPTAEDRKAQEVAMDLIKWITHNKTADLPIERKRAIRAEFCRRYASGFRSVPNQDEAYYADCDEMEMKAGWLDDGLIDNINERPEQ